MMQRLQLQQEQQHQEPIVVSSKGKLKREYKNRKKIVLQRRNIECVLKIQQDLRPKHHYRTQFDVQLSFEADETEQLGELGVSQVFLGYKALKTEITKEWITFSLSQKHLPYLKLTDMYQLLDKFNVPDVRLQLEKYAARHQYLNKIQMNTKEEILQAENYARQYPFECYMIRFYEGSSQISQYSLNEKYLQLMGITQEMMMEYLSEQNSIPTALKLNSYIETWLQVMDLVNNNKMFSLMEIRGYDGITQFIQVQQKRVYYRVGEVMYLLVYWVYLMQPNEQIVAQNYQKHINSKLPKTCSYRLIDRDDN